MQYIKITLKSLCAECFHNWDSSFDFSSMDQMQIFGLLQNKNEFILPEWSIWDMCRT